MTYLWEINFHNNKDINRYKISFSFIIFRIISIQYPVKKDYSNYPIISLLVMKIRYYIIYVHIKVLIIVFFYWPLVPLQHLAELKDPCDMYAIVLHNIEHKISKRLVSLVSNLFYFYVRWSEITYLILTDKCKESVFVPTIISFASNI